MAVVGAHLSMLLMCPPTLHKASLERLFILQLLESGDPGSIGWPG